MSAAVAANGTDSTASTANGTAVNGVAGTAAATDAAADTQMQSTTTTNSTTTATTAATTNGDATAPASTAATSASALGDIPPNQTLYVNNLNEKIKKDEMKKALYLVFSQYGNIVEINILKGYRLQGQAWVVFDSLTAATRAQRELQNFLFFGKPMRIAFAKQKSDVIAKIDGTYQQRTKRKATEEAGGKKKGTTQSAAKKQKTGEAKPKAAAPAIAAPAAAAAPTQPAVPTEPPAPPHRILFVENLPPQATDMMLSMLFSQYPGFVNARVIPGKQVAFVEYNEVFQAAAAMEALQGFKITTTHLMKISFAKK